MKQKNYNSRLFYFHGYIIEWIYHRQALMKFSGWGVMQYIRHRTLDLKFVCVFRKVNSRQRRKEKHYNSLNLVKFSLLLCINETVGDTTDLNNLFNNSNLRTNFLISQSIIKVQKWQTTFWKSQNKEHLMLQNIEYHLLVKRNIFLYSILLLSKL